MVNQNFQQLKGMERYIKEYLLKNTKRSLLGSDTERMILNHTSVFSYIYEHTRQVGNAGSAASVGKFKELTTTDFPIRFLIAVLFFLTLFLAPSFTHAAIINKSASTTASGLTNTDLNSSTAGLVGYWPFDGKYMTWASGTTTVGTSTDASGNGNNGTLVGMNSNTSMVAGKIGQALKFNGTSQYVSAINSSAYNITTFTLSMWVKTTAFGGTLIGTSLYPWELGINEGRTDNSSNPGQPCFYNGGGWQCTTSTTVNNGKWNLITVIVSGGRTFFYINGNLNTTDTQTAPTGDTVGLYFASRDSGPSVSLNGSMDDVRIYNRALSATEVKQLYNYGLTTIDNTNVNLTNSDLGPTSSSGTGGTSGLTAYYPFSGQYMTWKSGSPTVGTSTDATGNTANNAKLVNMNRATSVVTGRSGQALMFDGATSYVQGTTALIATGATTVCAWIKQSSFVSTANAIVANMKFIFFTSSTNNTLGLTSDGSTNPTGATNAIVNGVWQFVCGTRNASGIANLYVNASSSGTVNQSSGTPAASTFNTDIGVAGNHISDFFAGSVSDVRIYSRVLSATEITQLYNETKGALVNKSPQAGGLTNTDLTSASSTVVGGGNPNPSGLIAYWPFDGKYMTWKSGSNTIGTSTDASGNGYNGTLVNMNRTSSIVSGKIGQAISLNSTSTNSYVNVGATATNVETVAFWFKPNSITQSILALSSTVNITTASDVLTATGFTSPTIYIDGVNTAANPNASTTVISGWHFIVVTTATPVNANAVTLGKVSSAYFSGILDDVRLYNRVLSATEVKQLYNMTGGTSPAGGGGSAGCGAHTITGPDGLTYGTVLGADGNCWLDRNLGATEVATSSTDYQAYGSLFQWGRGADGHQLITWTGISAGTVVNGTTSVLSSTDQPSNALFIVAPSSPYDWRSPQNGNLWQGLSGINNPCPVGFALPTDAQWVALVADSNITNSASAFGSTTLKLPAAGYRYYSSGVLNSPGGNGYYWSSSPDSTNAYYLRFNSTSVYPAYDDSRAIGFSVRCVKD